MRWFYRKVTIEDINERIDEYDKAIPKEAMIQAREGDRHKAIKTFRDIRGGGLIDAKGVIDEYMKFLQMLEDWKEDKDIYTDY